MTLPNAVSRGSSSLVTKANPRYTAILNGARSPLARIYDEVPTFQSLAAHGRVLIVEDDSGARELIADALRLTGYIVRTAADGLAALRLIEIFEPDVVVLDLGLPIASGFEVLHELRLAPRTEETPVIAISGLVNGVKLARDNPEFFDILPKPFDPDTLVRIVRRAFRTRS